jgi:hypothetical protein
MCPAANEQPHFPVRQDASLLPARIEEDRVPRAVGVPELPIRWQKRIDDRLAAIVEQ